MLKQEWKSTMSGNEFKTVRLAERILLFLQWQFFFESDFQSKEKTNYTPARMQICVGM